MSSRKQELIERDRKSYDLPTSISIPDLVKVLKKLQIDADEQYSFLAKDFVKYADNKYRNHAMFFVGQVDILNRLAEVLSGALEDEGLESTIYMGHRWELND